MKDREVGRILVGRGLLREKDLQAALVLQSQLLRQNRSLTLADILVATNRLSVEDIRGAVPDLEVVNRNAATMMEDPEETVDDLRKLGRYTIVREAA